MSNSSHSGGDSNRRKGRRWCLKEAPDSLVYKALKLWMEFKKTDPKHAVKKVQEALSRDPKWADWNITRERVCDLVGEANRRRFLVLCPPMEEELSTRMADSYGLYGKHQRTIEVVNASGEGAHDDVCRSAAGIVHKMILDLAQQRGSGSAIHLGMAVGNSTKKVAGYLRDRFRGNPDCPDFVVHGLSSEGFSTSDKVPAPGTFARYLKNGTNKVSYVHVDAPSVVDCSEYSAARSSCAVRRAFERASEIDILITAFACADHEHAVYRSHLHWVRGGGVTRRLLEEQDWVGDVICQPYSETGPITLEEGFRSVVLFEIPELVELANAKAKDIVLVGGPCSMCEETRAKALRPLVKEPSLRMWTHLVTDVKTACKLLQKAA